MNQDIYKSFLFTFIYIPCLGVVISTVTVAVVTEFSERLVDITADFVGVINTDVDLMTGDVDITGIVGLSDNFPDDVTLTMDETINDNVGDTDTEVNEGVTETLGDKVDDKLGCNVDTVRDTVDEAAIVDGVREVGVGFIDDLCDGVVDTVVDDTVVVSL